MRNKNMCAYCGTASRTNAPFPKKGLSGGWRLFVCPRCFSIDNIKLLESDPVDAEEFQERTITRHKNEPPKKLLCTKKNDLMLWFEDDGSILGFQFTSGSKAFTWKRDSGTKFHQIVNEGGKHYNINTLKSNGGMSKEELIDEFSRAGKNLKREYKDLVLEVFNSLDS